MTSTATETSIMTFCPSAFSSYLPSAYPNSGGSGSGGSGNGGPGSGGSGGSGSGGTGGSSGSSGTGTSGTGTDGSQAGPCPGMGYTCSDCLDGWFCPPSQTPAAQVPCGYGWPCYHCPGGWFCVPEPQNAAPPAPAPAPAPVHAHSTSGSNIAIPTATPAANGYQYVGCYQDTPNRALRDAQLSPAAGGLTNGQCVDFCRTQGFAIAGTESGSQCFCGTLLVDSVALANRQCNTSCTGDAANSTMCGGSWALSIWTIDGSIRQAKSPKRDTILATAPAPVMLQSISGVKSKFDIATAVYGWPPVSSPAMQPESLASMNTSRLEQAILAAVAAEAGGFAFEPASASNIIQSVSMILNMGMSSIAHDLSLALPTSKENEALFPGVTGIQLGNSLPISLSSFATAQGTFPVTAAASIPSAYTSENDGTLDSGIAAVAQGVPGGGGGDVNDRTTDTGDDEGSYVFPILPGVTTPSVTRGRRAPRRWAGWE